MKNRKWLKIIIVQYFQYVAIRRFDLQQYLVTNHSWIQKRLNITVYEINDVSGDGLIQIWQHWEVFTAALSTRFVLRPPNAPPLRSHRGPDRGWVVAVAVAVRGRSFAPPLPGSDRRKHEVSLTLRQYSTTLSYAGRPFATYHYTWWGLALDNDSECVIIQTTHYACGFVLARGLKRLLKVSVKWVKAWGWGINQVSHQCEVEFETSNRGGKSVWRHFGFISKLYEGMPSGKTLLFVTIAPVAYWLVEYCSTNLAFMLFIHHWNQNYLSKTMSKTKKYYLYRHQTSTNALTCIMRIVNTLCLFVKKLFINLFRTFMVQSLMTLKSEYRSILNDYVKLSFGK